LFYGQNVDSVVFLLDAVDHAEVAAARAVQSSQPELERSSDPMRIGRQ